MVPYIYFLTAIHILKRSLLNKDNTDPNSKLHHDFGFFYLTTHSQRSSREETEESLLRMKYATHRWLIQFSISLYMSWRPVSDTLQSAWQTDNNWDQPTVFATCLVPDSEQFRAFEFVSTSGISTVSVSSEIQKQLLFNHTKKSRICFLWTLFCLPSSKLYGTCRGLELLSLTPRETLVEPQTIELERRCTKIIRSK